MRTLVPNSLKLKPASPVRSERLNGYTMYQVQGYNNWTLLSPTEDVPGRGNYQNSLHLYVL